MGLFIYLFFSHKGSSNDKCATCGLSLGKGKQVKAVGKKYHVGCFVCNHCRKPLRGEFHLHEGKPYCKEDLLNLFSEKCSGCNQPINEKEIIALDKKWHEGC